MLTKKGKGAKFISDVFAQNYKKYYTHKVTYIFSSSGTNFISFQFPFTIETLHLCKDLWVPFLSIQVHCGTRLAIFPARESLVRDIPAGDGNIAILFLQCRYTVHCTMYKLTLLVHTVIHLPHSLKGYSYTIRWILFSQEISYRFKFEKHQRTYKSII